MADARSYEECLALEADRERHYRQTQQGRFEAAMLSLDRLNDAFDDPTKIGAFSDGGAGAADIVGFVTAKYAVGHCLDRIKWARVKAARMGRATLRVLNLILKNGNDREKSICELQAMKAQDGNIKSHKKRGKRRHRRHNKNTRQRSNIGIN